MSMASNSTSDSECHLAVQVQLYEDQSVWSIDNAIEFALAYV